MDKPTGSYISYFSNMVKQFGGINLAQGIPGFNPPQELTNELNNISHTNIHQYAPGMGNFDLLNLLQQKYEVNRNNLLVVQGATEGLSLVYTYLLHKLGPDFSVMAFDPAYECYTNLPRIFGQKLVLSAQNSDNAINMDQLASEIAQNGIKVIFVGSPGNPYGKVWTKAEVDKLIQLSDILDFYILFDAVYSELYFSKKPYVPVQKLNERLFIVGSFSKALCITGWRIGFVIMHDSHATGIQSVHDYIGLCAPSVLQQALANYLLLDGLAANFMAQFRKNISKSFASLKQTLLELGFVIPSIDGGCFIWAKLPATYTDGFEFASQLYQKHRVAIIPGEHFSRNCTNWVRFNIARPMPEIEAAQQELQKFIQP